MGAPLQKLSLIDQWQFWKVTRPVHGCTFTKLSLIDQWQFSQTPLAHLLLYKTVIDQSMTVLKGIKTCPWVHLYRNCHWSMTFFKSVIDQWQFLKLSLIDQWQFLKLSLIDQWQFWKVSRPVHGCTFTESVIDQWHFSKVSLINDIFQNCHWSINDNF